MKTKRLVFRKWKGLIGPHIVRAVERKLNRDAEDNTRVSLNWIEIGRGRGEGLRITVSTVVQMDNIKLKDLRNL